MKEKDGLASISAFAAVELGSIVTSRKLIQSSRAHIVLAPRALQYLLHAVANSEHKSGILSYIFLYLYTLDDSQLDQTSSITGAPLYPKVVVG